ncbi:MAG: addiction module protein [Methylococcales bacterium]
MNTTLSKLSIEERIKLVEDLWDSIASDQIDTQVGSQINHISSKFHNKQIGHLERLIIAFQ